MKRNLLTWVVVLFFLGVAVSQNTFSIDIETDSNGKIKSITPQSTLTFYDPTGVNQTKPTSPMPIVVKSSTTGKGMALEILNNQAKYCYSSLNAANVNLWSTGGQAFTYLFALIYLFLGVSIVADQFMSAIEVITSQERTIITTDKDENEIVINVQVWNETVANLTLMALGSSAPEILLAVLETVTTLGQPAGPLGASTIVGSASFNLFIISAVCVISVPERNPRSGETGFRTLSQPGVFAITAFSSVWAYFWMLIVLVWVSPGRVEVWEAVVTFLKFPLLVGCAYAQDAGYFANCCGRGNRVNDSDKDATGPDGLPVPRTKLRLKDVTIFDKEKRTAFQLIKATDPTSLTLEANEAYVENLAARIAAQQPAQKISRMQYRVNATRLMAGKKPLFTMEEAAEMAVSQRKSVIENEEREFEEKHSVEMKEADGPRQKMYRSTFEFASRRYAVREDEGEVKVVVRRLGDLGGTHTVYYRTADGTATENEDYIPIQGTLVFNEGEAQKQLEIEIVEDEEVEDDEDFFVLLENPTGESIQLGANNVVKVIIIDVSQPGTLQFKHRNERCRETDGKVTLVVERVNGSMDKVGCSYETRDGTAIEGQHYAVAQGEVVFEHGETEQIIEIGVMDNEEVEAERQFSVVLKDPFGKATLNDVRVVANITISDDERYSKLVNRVIDAVALKKRKMSLDTASWRDQVKDAMEISHEVSVLGYFLHALAFPWKVLFSFIPPTTYYNGWLTFGVSLACVGAVTFVIGEFAGMLGCVVGISEAIVAITLVAIGTSMPDTFASRTATILAPDADAAIGNITGSNSVNVFLGLGLPWLMASIYQEARGEVYVVPSGTLDFAVLVFTPLAAAVLGLLVLRRYYAGGELGGDYQWPTFVLFCSIWLLFIILSVLKSTGAIA